MHELLHFDGCLQLLLCQDLLIYLENTKNVIYAYTDLYIFFDEHIFIFKQLNGKKKEKLLNKVIFFILFVHKKYSRCYIILRLNHWSHTDYLNNVLTTFLGLECGSCIAVYEGLESSQIRSKVS